MTSSLTLGILRSLGQRNRRGSEGLHRCIIAGAPGVVHPAHRNLSLEARIRHVLRQDLEPVKIVLFRVAIAK